MEQQRSEIEEQLPEGWELAGEPRFYHHERLEKVGHIEIPCRPKPKPNPPARVWLVREEETGESPRGVTVKVTKTPLTLDGLEGDALIDKLGNYIHDYSGKY